MDGGLCEASTLSKYKRMVIYLFCVLVRGACDVFIKSAVTCTSLFIFPETAVVCILFRFCLMCAGVTFFHVLMCIMYL